MISLFLDTSSDKLCVSLVKDNEVIYENYKTTKNDHSTYLVSIINEGLNKNNLTVTDINKILVSIGPGSFTGTRIAVTVAKTLAWSLNINVIPVSSLREYIYAYNNYDYYVPVLEDKKGIYYAVYDKDYNEVEKEKYVSKDNFNLNLKGNVLLINDENKKIDVVNLIKHETKEINAHLLKPNYVKKIEVEEKL